VHVQRPSSGASAEDVVALYTHPSAARSILPVIWRNLTASDSSYPATGSSSVTFKLLNFRQNFIVRLVGNGTFSPVVLAESAVIKNTNPDVPGQVHLALHEDGSSVVVQWVSGSAVPQQLRYSSTAVHLADLSSASSTGSTPDRQYSSTTGGAAAVLSTARSYDRGMMCGEPATTFGFMHPGYMHTAVIPGTDVGYNRLLHYRYELYRMRHKQEGAEQAFSGLLLSFLADSAVIVCRLQSAQHLLGVHASPTAHGAH
jgi:hypothetical protein